MLVLGAKVVRVTRMKGVDETNTKFQHEEREQMVFSGHSESIGGGCL